MTTLVIALDLVLAAAAVVAGACLAIGGRRLLAGRLQGTPFKTLLWPGVTLLVVAGGSLLAAGLVLLLGDAHTGRLVSVEAGVVLAAWGAMMLSLAGYKHWAQAAPLVLGIAVVVLSFAVRVPG